jgi:hypothetical protein
MSSGRSPEKIYVKITTEEERDGCFQFKTGLNILNKPFEGFNGSYVASGFQYTDLENIHHFYGSGVWLRIVKVPDNAQVVEECGGIDKNIKIWYTDKLIFNERYPLYNYETFKKFNFKITYKYILEGCKNRFHAYFWVWKTEWIELISNYMDKSEIIDGIKYACFEGNEKALVCFKESGVELKYNEEALDYASHHGNVNVLKWWKNSGLELKYSENALDWASLKGHLNVLEWWKNSGLKLKYSENALGLASKCNHVEVLEWWLKSNLPLKYSEKALKEALNSAYENGYTSILSWWEDYFEKNPENTHDFNELFRKWKTKKLMSSDKQSLCDGGLIKKPSNPGITYNYDNKNGHLEILKRKMTDTSTNVHYTIKDDLNLNTLKKKMTEILKRQMTDTSTNVQYTIKDEGTTEVLNPNTPKNYVDVSKVFECQKLNKTYVKITNKDECHNGFQYQTGLNILETPFKKSLSFDNALYFTDLENVHHFYGYGIWLRIVEIPDDADVVSYPNDTQDGVKWSTNKLVLGDKYPLSDLDTLKMFKIEITPEYIRWASANCHIDVLQKLKDSDNIKENEEQLLTYLYSSGNKEVIEWWKKSFSFLADKESDSTDMDCSEDIFDCSEDDLDCSEDDLDCSGDDLDCSGDDLDCSGD